MSLFLQLFGIWPGRYCWRSLPKSSGFEKKTMIATKKIMVTKKLIKLNFKPPQIYGKTIT